NGAWPPARREMASFQRTKEREEDRCSLNIYYVRNTTQGTAPACSQGRYIMYSRIYSLLFCQLLVLIKTSIKIL
ncbi:C9orf92 isoform 3, partial [Pan troglodytes]